MYSPYNFFLHILKWNTISYFWRCMSIWLIYSILNIGWAWNKCHCSLTCSFINNLCDKKLKAFPTSLFQMNWELIITVKTIGKMVPYSLLLFTDRSCLMSQSCYFFVKSYFFFARKQIAFALVINIYIL